MIAWVNQACKDWGRAQWWLMFKGEGFPTRTMLAKFIEEGVHGAACNAFTMTYPEVLTGYNLLVGNAIKLLPELPRAIVSVHYVLRMPARAKAKRIGITRDQYYEVLWKTHIPIANSIEAQEIRISKQSERQLVGIANAL